MKRPDLTIAECFAEDHKVYLSCEPCRVGRHLDYTLTGRWADRRLLDLIREGVFACYKCGRPSGFISVSAHLVVEPLLQWRLGDDAMPNR